MSIIILILIAVLFSGIYAHKISIEELINRIEDIENQMQSYNNNEE